MTPSRSLEAQEEDRRILLDPSAPPSSLEGAFGRLLEDGGFPASVPSPSKDSHEIAHLRLRDHLKVLQEAGAFSLSVRTLLVEASRGGCLPSLFDALCGAPSQAEPLPESLRETFFQEYLRSLLREERLNAYAPPPQAFRQMGATMIRLSQGLQAFLTLYESAQQALIASCEAFASPHPQVRRTLVQGFSQGIEELRGDLIYEAARSIIRSPSFRTRLLLALLPHLQEDPSLSGLFLLALAGGETTFLVPTVKTLPPRTSYALSGSLLLSLLEEVGEEEFFSLLKTLLQEGVPLRDVEALTFLASPQEYRGMPPAWWLPLLRGRAA